MNLTWSALTWKMLFSYLKLENFIDNLVCFFCLFCLPLRYPRCCSGKLLLLQLCHNRLQSRLIRRCIVIRSSFSGTIESLCVTNCL